MVLTPKSGLCHICNCRGYTEWHHIISQHHSIKTKQNHLLHNPKNVVELCKRCHDQTTASMVRKRLTKRHGPINTRGKRGRATPEEKRLAKERKKLAREKKVDDSMQKIVARGAGIWRRYSRPRSTIKKFREIHGGDVIGVEMGNLYPSDHWLHSPEQYSSSLSKRFERDWLWTMTGGAYQKSKMTTEEVAQWMKK